MVVFIIVLVNEVTASGGIYNSEKFFRAIILQHYIKNYSIS